MVRFGVLMLFFSCSLVAMETDNSSDYDGEKSEETSSPTNSLQSGFGAQGVPLEGSESTNSEERMYSSIETLKLIERLQSNTEFLFQLLNGWFQAEKQRLEVEKKWFAIEEETRRDLVKFKLIKLQLQFDLSEKKCNKLKGKYGENWYNELAGLKSEYLAESLDNSNKD